VLIPWLGLTGAAIVTTVSLVAGRVGFALGVRRVIPELSKPHS
jgi:hypothetical protein